VLALSCEKSRVSQLSSLVVRENLDALELSSPTCATRILVWVTFLSLIERVERKVDKEKANDRFEKSEQSFDLEDFKEQITQYART